VEDYVAQIARRLDASEPVAAKGVGIVLNLLRQHGPEDLVERLFAALPGAHGLADGAEEGLSVLGGLIGGSHGLGGMIGSSVGAAGAHEQLLGLGLEERDIPRLVQAVLKLARQILGDEDINVLIAKSPGLGQLL